MDENSYRRRLSFCKDLSGVLLNHIIILISEEGEMGGGGNIIETISLMTHFHA